MRTIFSWLKCHCARTAERIFPVSLLWLVLWPMAACGAARDVLMRPNLFRPLDFLPGRLRPRQSTGRFKLWRSRTNMRVSAMLCYWPDRLNTHGWQRRCRYENIDRVDELVKAGHSVILAGFHVGPIKCLPHFMRARGMEMATLSNMPKAPVYQNWVYNLSDVAYGLQGVPRRLRTSQLRDVVDFLTPKRVIYVAVDGIYGKRIEITQDGVRFQMASGFLRLAARTSSRIVPCLIETDGPLRFTIHCGTAIAQQLVDDPSHHEEAGRQVIQQLLPWLQPCSHQYCTGHLRDYHRDATTPAPLWQTEGALT